MIMRKVILSAYILALLSGCTTKSTPNTDQHLFRIGQIVVTHSADAGSVRMAVDLKRRLEQATRQCMSKLPTNLPTSDLNVALTHYNHLQPVGIVFAGRSSVRGTATIDANGGNKTYNFRLADDPQVNWQKMLSSERSSFFGPEMTRDRMAFGVTTMILQRLFPRCRGFGQVQQGRRYSQTAATADSQYQPMINRQRSGTAPAHISPGVSAARPPIILTD